MGFFKKSKALKTLKQAEKLERELAKIRAKAITNKPFIEIKKEILRTPTKDIGQLKDKKPIIQKPEKEYITKDTNLKLLFIIIIFSAIFLSATFFFQYRLKNLTNDYYDKLDELKKISTELNQKKNLLQETTQTLELKEKREEDLSDQYLTLKTIKESLERERSKLLNDNAQLQNSLAQARRDLEDANRKIAILKDRVEELGG